MALKAYLSLFLTIVWICVPSVLHAQDVIGAFEEGMEALENDDPRKAVEIWSEYSERNSEPDYRIGFYFVKTVTANNMRDYYEMASNLYYRGLESETITDEAKKTLDRDLEFMRPLLGQREARRLANLIEEKNPQVYREIQQFWDSLKLSIDDNYNERLLEHWERCHYASEHFQTTSRHEFDDRGDIYIKYGEPQRKRDGQLLYNSGFADYVLSTRMRSKTAGSRIGDAVDASAIYNTMTKIREYHDYPLYEVWVYTELSDNIENVIYLFGNTTGSNVMSLVQSADDFIPSAAYNTTGRNRPVSFSAPQGGGLGSAELDPDERSNIAGADETVNFASDELISPALVMQLMYYRQLSSIDDYFLSQYDRMMDRYMSTASDLGSTIAREFQHINESRIIRRQARAPDHSTSQLDEIFKVSSHLYTYRFLDDEMNPYLRVYLDADPDEAIYYEELRRQSSLDNVLHDNFEIVNQLKLMSETGEGIDMVVDTFRVRSGDEIPTDLLAENMTTVDHLPELYELESKFELNDRHKNSNHSIYSHSTFKDHVKGIGISSTQIEPPLEIDGFAVSDVILGFSLPDETGTGGMEIANERQIPQNRNLIIYYEAYNVPETDEGLYSFTLNYEIKKDRSWFGRAIRFGRDSGKSITIENTDDSPTFSQLLEIVSEEFENGDYTLNLTFLRENEEEVLYEKEISFTIN